MAQETSSPRFNHVAMSVPAELLSVAGREQLLGFYREVFGWDEMPTLSIEGERLVLRVYRDTQFVFLIADKNPMTCPKMDHFGIQVTSLRELEKMLEGAKKFQARDDRVEIIDKQVDHYEGFLDLHNFYVRYLLPMMVEVQYYDWAKPPATS